MRKVLVILQGHVHVVSQGYRDQLRCSLLLIVEQGIEANTNHVLLVRPLKGQKGNVLGKIVPLGLNELPPGFEYDGLLKQACLLGLENTLLERTED